jgi:hypothetical protein
MAAMRLAIDLDTREVRTWAGAVLPVLAAKRRDRFPVQVRFTRGGEVQELASGTTGKVGLKAAAEGPAGDFVALAASFTKTGGGTSATYSFDVNLNTTELEALFEDEPVAVPLLLEIEIAATGLRISSAAVPVDVADDLIRGDEDAPTPVA